MLITMKYDPHHFFFKFLSENRHNPDHWWASGAKTLNWSSLLIWQKRDSTCWMLTFPLTNSVALNLVFILSGLQIPTCDSKNSSVSVPIPIPIHTPIPIPILSLSLSLSLPLFLSNSSSISVSINIIRMSTKCMCDLVITITSQNCKIISTDAEMEFIHSIKSSEL